MLGSTQKLKSHQPHNNNIWILQCILHITSHNPQLIKSDNQSKTATQTTLAMQRPPYLLALSGLLAANWSSIALAFSPSVLHRPTVSPFILYATLAQEDSINVSIEQKHKILQMMETTKDVGNEYAEMFGLSHTESAIFAFFCALRQAGTPLGLNGEPFVLRRDEILQALQAADAPFDDFFTMKDFAKAVEDDFLDAARGSTDNRKGWKVSFYVVLVWFLDLCDLFIIHTKGSYCLQTILFRLRRYRNHEENPLRKPA